MELKVNAASVKQSGSRSARIRMRMARRAAAAAILIGSQAWKFRSPPIRNLTTLSFNESTGQNSDDGSRGQCAGRHVRLFQFRVGRGSRTRRVIIRDQRAQCDLFSGCVWLGNCGLSGCRGAKQSRSTTPTPPRIFVHAAVGGRAVVYHHDGGEFPRSGRRDGRRIVHQRFWHHGDGVGHQPTALYVLSIGRKMASSKA